MSRTSLVWLVWICSVSAVSASTGVFAEAISYTKPLPDGKIFVMLGDAAIEEKATASKPDLNAKLRDLRQRYPKSGVYRETSGEPIWQLPDTVFSPIDGTYLSQDGRYLVRIEGDWWRTKDFPGGKRPSGEQEQKQLSATAVSFFDQGQLLKSHLLKDLLQDSRKLMHSPQHLLWYAGGSLNESQGQYLLFTQDSSRAVFDFRTGELLRLEAMGLGNPIFQSILVVCAVLSALILFTWVYFVFIKGVKPVGAA